MSPTTQQPFPRTVFKYMIDLIPVGLEGSLIITDQTAGCVATTRTIIVVKTDIPRQGIPNGPNISFDCSMFFIVNDRQRTFIYLNIIGRQYLFSMFIVKRFQFTTHGRKPSAER